MPEDPASRYLEGGEGPAAGPAVAEAPDPLLETPGASHRVLVTGGSGFLGRHLIRRLRARGHEVRGLARKGPPGELADLEVEWWTGDVTDPTDIIGAAVDCDRVVHLAGSYVPAGRNGPEVELHLEGTRNVLWEAQDAGVERFVYVSALGARPAGTPFYRAKFRAEEEVRSAGLEGLVFRPAVVYGPGDHFTVDLRWILDRYPVFPLFGSGEFRLQPVVVEDVEEALCQAVERQGFVDDTFELAGPRPLPFREVIEAVGEVAGTRRRAVRLPPWLYRPVRTLARRLGWPPPFPPARLERLREGGILGDREHALRDVFRLEPLPFREVLADYF